MVLSAHTIRRSWNAERYFRTYGVTAVAGTPSEEKKQIFLEGMRAGMETKLRNDFEWLTSDDPLRKERATEKILVYSEFDALQSADMHLVVFRLHETKEQLRDYLGYFCRRVIIDDWGLQTDLCYSHKFYESKKFLPMELYNTRVYLIRSILMKRFPAAIWLLWACDPANKMAKPLDRMQKREVIEGLFYQDYESIFPELTRERLRNIWKGERISAEEIRKMLMREKAKHGEAKQESAS